MKKNGLKAIALTILCTALTAQAAENFNFIPTGDFESGISDFGITYSSRADTAMPMIFADNDADGNAVLRLVSGADLGEESSESAASMGFAYQGIYYKDFFNVNEGKSYTASSDIYTDVSGVKMRFVEMDGDKAIAASEETEIKAGKLNSIYYTWKADRSTSKNRLRIVFYNFKKGDRIYIDNVKYTLSDADCGAWSVISKGTVSSADKVTYEGITSDTNGGIRYSADKGYFSDNGKYYAAGVISTDADKAYVTVSCENIPGSRADYIVRKGEKKRISLPIETENVTGTLNVKFEISGRNADSKFNTYIEDFDIASEDKSIEITEDSGNLVFSGRLRVGNENETVSVSVTDFPEFKIQVKSDGSYSFLKPIADFDGVYKTVDVKITGISGYGDINNEISGSYVLVNTKYIEEILKKLSAAKTGDEVKQILGEDECDALGISQIPVFVTANEDKVFGYIAGKDISTKDKLIKEVTAGSAIDTLNNRKKSFSEVIDECAEALGADKAAAYDDIYAKTADKSRINEIFEKSGTTAKDINEFEYLFTETLVKYKIEKSVNYSEGMTVLKKYAAALKLDLSKYERITSSQNKQAAASGIIGYIKTADNFSSLQSRIDSLSSSSPSGGTGGSGSGSSGGSNYGKVTVSDYSSSNAQGESYRFNDLDGYSWASESIYGLLESGVISESDNGKFRPSDNITRAEFAKMAAQKGGYTQNDGEEKFSDVKKNDWYFPYVSALGKAGIINGISDDYFGASENITREDICVIIARYMNLAENGAEGSFTDFNDISDYAVSAVKAMSEKGYINGYEDGKFRPKNPATRAETAKILYSIK